MFLTSHLHTLETEWQTDTAPAAQETENGGKTDSQTTVVSLNPVASHKLLQPSERFLCLYGFMVGFSFFCIMRELMHIANQEN